MPVYLQNENDPEKKVYSRTSINDIEALKVEKFGSIEKWDALEDDEKEFYTNKWGKLTGDEKEITGNRENIATVTDFKAGLDKRVKESEAARLVLVKEALAVPVNDLLEKTAKRSDAAKYEDELEDIRLAAGRGGYNVLNGWIKDDANISDEVKAEVARRAKKSN